MTLIVLNANSNLELTMVIAEPVGHFRRLYTTRDEMGSRAMSL